MLEKTNEQVVYECGDDPAKWAKALMKMSNGEFGENFLAYWVGQIISAERRLAAERKRSHGELCNRILGQGKNVRLERLSYRAFQKTFGRSVKVRAPGMFVSMLLRKAESAGGEVTEIRTRYTKLSQFDHTTGEYVKKPISQRTHVFGDGKTEPVHRDLYSAFLARHCGEDYLDIRQVQKAWPDTEPFLRRAMSKDSQSASGCGFPLPHGLAVRAGRAPKRDIFLSEAA